MIPSRLSHYGPGSSNAPDIGLHGCVNPCMPCGLGHDDEESDDDSDRQLINNVGLGYDIGRIDGGLGLSADGV